MTAGAANNSKLLTLENGLVWCCTRSFTLTEDGGLCTTEYRNIVSGQTFFRGISPEANLTLDYEGCPAQFHTVVQVDSTLPKTAREEWTIAAVSGQTFRLLFAKSVSNYQPMVSEFQFRVGRAVQPQRRQRSNCTTAQCSI